MATFLSLKLRIALLSWSTLRVIHSITSEHGKTEVLATTWCSLNLAIFLYMILLSLVLRSSCRKTWNSFLYNSLNSVLHVKTIFLSTRHSVSVNIHISWFSAGSLTIFLLFFKEAFHALFLLKHEISHDPFILFH